MIYLDWTDKYKNFECSHQNLVQTHICDIKKLWHCGSRSIGEWDIWLMTGWTEDTPISTGFSYCQVKQELNQRTAKCELLKLTT